MKKNLILIVIVCFAQQLLKAQEQASFPYNEAFKNLSITYKLIPALNNTWGV